MVLLRLFRRNFARQLNGNTRCWNRSSTLVSSKTESNGEMKLRTLLQNWPGLYRVPVNELFSEIAAEKQYELVAKSIHIDSKTWLEFLSNYRRKLMKAPLELFDNNRDSFESFISMLNVIIQKTAEEKSSFHQDVLSDLKKMLSSKILKQAESSLADHRAAYKALCLNSDLRSPQDWYAHARLMRRKIIYHGGPTNSGKTYQALCRLREAKAEHGGGLYCGPLRLLALEVYEQLNRAGVYCDLLTGQEQRHVPFSTHTSCTVEMVNIHRDYDVAVIDEIQMIADGQRGHAWTRALHGLRAREIHVCGGIDASKVVKSFASEVGDDFELRTYERLSPLKILDTSLRGDYSKIQAGDCIVAFSKADIFAIKREIELHTPHRCCMVYGQLPPETRSTQARLFNEEDTGFDVLVASDAIGMGLNLNIRRVIFHTVIKKGKPNEGPAWVDPSLIRQIAGRAGRKSSLYKHGEVTAWQDADLAYIRAAMEFQLPQISQVGLAPSVEQIEAFADLAQQSFSELDENVSESEWDEDGAVVPDPSSETVSTTNKLPATPSESKPKYDIKTARLSTLLQRFVELAQMDGRYFMCDHEDKIIVSNWLHTIPMSLADKFTFCNAPASTRDRMTMTVLYQFAATYAQGRPVALNVRLPNYKPRDVIDLTDLCSQHNILDLYLWLSYRYPKYFIEREACLEQKQYAIKLIDGALHSSSLQQKYNFIYDYKRTREMTKDSGNADGLKYMIWPEVRTATKKYLDAIPLEHRFVFLSEEGQSSSNDVMSDRSERTRSRRKDHDSSGNFGKGIKFSRNRKGNIRDGRDGKIGERY